MQICNYHLAQLLTHKNHSLLLFKLINYQKTQIVDNIYFTLASFSKKLKTNRKRFFLVSKTEATPYAVA